jgi:hypothetical protein
MKRKKVFLVLVVMSVFLLSPAWRQQQKDVQATIVKVVKDVKKKGPTTGWQEAIGGNQLSSGYSLRTEQGSFAMIKFPDETKIIVRQNSVVEIKGQVQGRQILDRSVHMQKGDLAFDVRKQEKEQFRFSSPISVASIRGTKGGFTSDLDLKLDQLIISEGLATLLNLISRVSQDIGSGKIGISYGDGKIEVNTANTQQLNLGDINNTGQGGGTSGQQKTKKSLRIPGEDKDGNKKTIIFEWEE